MKKIYALLFVVTILCNSVFAQNLTSQNLTAVVTGFPSEPLLQGFVDIVNTSGVSVDVGCERIEQSVVAGSMNNFCWGLLCYPSTTSISLLPETIDPGVLNSTFYADYQPQNTVGISSIDYKFFDVNNPGDAVTVNIQFDTQTLGINNLNSQNSYLNIASRPGNSIMAVAYNVAGNSNNQLKLYNLLGNTVKSFNLNKNGTMVVSTSGLSNGVYVFCLEANGKKVATKKVVVSK